MTIQELEFEVGLAKPLYHIPGKVYRALTFLHSMLGNPFPAEVVTIENALKLINLAKEQGITEVDDEID